MLIYVCGADLCICAPSFGLVISLVLAPTASSFANAENDLSFCNAEVLATREVVRESRQNIAAPMGNSEKYLLVLHNCWTVVFTYHAKLLT